MKRLIVASLALALSLSACATTPDTPPTPGGPGGGGGVIQPPGEQPPELPREGGSTAATVIARADTVILTGERGFAAAEVVYTAASHGVGRLVDAGAIKGATATRVRGWNTQARGLLVKGKATADAAERARAAAGLFGLADNLNALLGSK